MADRRPEFDHILATRPEGELVRAFERQGRDLRHEQRVGQIDEITTAAALSTETPDAAFRATRSTAQSIPISSLEKIIFTTIDYNPQGAYDTATGLFTVPNNASGIYSVTATVAMVLVNAGSLLFIGIIVNGTEVSRGVRIELHSGGTYAVSVSDHLNLVGGDQVAAHVLQNDGTRNTEAAAKSNHFSAVRLSR